MEHHNFHIYDYPHGKLYKAIAGEGAYVNQSPLLPPPTLSIADAILSFNPHVLNDETIKDLFQSSFSYRIIGSCGLDSIRVIKGNLGHTSTRILSLGTLQLNFICERTWLENDRLRWWRS